MRHLRGTSLIAVALGVALLSSACSGTEPAATEVTIAVEPVQASSSTTSTTTTSTTTTTVVAGPPQSCLDVVTDFVATIDAVLDAIEDDPDNDIYASEQVNDVFFDLGEALAQHCGFEYTGEAVSDVIVWLGSEKGPRGLFPDAFIDGFVPALCEFSGVVELNLPAQTVCLTA